MDRFCLQRPLFSWRRRGTLHDGGGKPCHSIVTISPSPGRHSRPPSACRWKNRTGGTVAERSNGEGRGDARTDPDVAEASVLAKGFGATSIEEVIAEAGLTKSGFFYHFRDKNELARAMLRRYVDSNDRVFDDVFDRGRQLSDDPLQAFLIALKLLAEVMRDLPNGHPGCLIASICYQERLFDREVREPHRAFCGGLERALPRASSGDRRRPSAARAGHAGRRRRHAVLRAGRRDHHVEDAQRSPVWNARS